MKAVVAIMPKKEILDPQSRATTVMLERIGFKGIKHLRQGKRILIELEEPDSEKAHRIIEEMCTDLLVNDLIEEYRIEMHPAHP